MTGNNLSIPNSLADPQICLGVSPSGHTGLGQSSLRVDDQNTKLFSRRKPGSGLTEALKWSLSETKPRSFTRRLA